MKVDKGLPKIFSKIGKSSKSLAKSTKSKSKAYIKKTGGKIKNKYKTFTSASSNDDNHENKDSWINSKSKIYTKHSRHTKSHADPAESSGSTSAADQESEPDSRRSKRKMRKMIKRTQVVKKMKSLPVLSAGYSNDEASEGSDTTTGENIASPASNIRSAERSPAPKKTKKIRKKRHRNQSKNRDSERKHFPITMDGGIQYKILLVLVLLLTITSVIGIIFIPFGDQISKRYAWYDYETKVEALIVTFGLSTCSALVLIVLLVSTQLGRIQKKEPSSVLVIAFIALALIFTVISFICSLVQNSTLDSIFGDGFQAAFQGYAEHHQDKITLDRIQIEFECCGVDSFEDWNGIENDERYVDGFVPFSCCDLKAQRPCIHEKIDSDNPQLDYRFPDDLTLNKVGCRYSMQQYYKEFILVDISISTICLILEIGIFIIFFLNYK